MDDADRDRRIGQVLAAYFEALDAGQAPDREAFLRQHPDLAEDLADVLRPARPLPAPRRTTPAGRRG